ncbi:MAG: BatD family protein [Lysobacterales bacterium]
MNRHSYFALTLLFAFYLFAGSAAASNMHSSVNTSQVGMGDSFELTLSIDAASANASPDLSPLEKDFRILGTGQNSQINIINGRSSESFSWVITLSPKEKGQLTIPAITAGQASSKPLNIEVVDADQLPAGTGGSNELSIEVTADTGAHYVQEEIPVTVRIRSGGEILQASLEEPNSSDFVLIKTGDDQFSNTTRNGKRFNVIERHYYLKPQKSGKLILPPLTLTASVESSPDPRASAFSNFGDFQSSMLRMPLGSSLLTNLLNPGHEVSVRSKPLELDVKPRPTGDAVWFLPAKRVQIQAEWDPVHPEFRVGEAVKRKISLFALGASQEQLPEIPLADADGARVYLDRSSDNTADTAEGTAAIREFYVSVVPTRSGEVSLPAIDVRWWDTVADRERVATLPAETLKVLPGTGVSMTPAATPAAASARANTAKSTPDAATEPRVTGTVAWRWAGLALAALLTLVFGTKAWLTNRRRRAHRPIGIHPSDGTVQASVAARSAETHRHTHTKLPAHEQAFIRACKANDLHAAYTSLNAWLRTASGLKIEYPAALTAEVSAMEAQLYAPAGEAGWNGRQALRAFSEVKTALRRSGRPAAGSGDIPGLYPA